MSISSTGMSPWEHRAFTVDEACEALRLSRASLYLMMAENEIRYVELRNRRRIPGSEIARLLAIA